MNIYTLSFFCLGLIALSCPSTYLEAHSTAKSNSVLHLTENRLVLASNQEIVKAIESHAQRQDFIKRTGAVTFAERAFNVLSLRKHTISEQAQIIHLKKRTDIPKHYCVLKGCYVAECSGILRKTIDKRAKSKEVVHVYGCATKRLFHKWENLPKPTRFEKYIKKHASKRALRNMRKNIIHYYTPEERKAFAVHFHEGKMMQNGQPMNGRYIFVLDAAGTTLYAGVKVVGRVQHSTFTAGEPVQCAGWIFVDNGVYDKANLSSGHYKPTEEAGERLRAFFCHHARLGEAAETITITKHYE